MQYRLFFKDQELGTIRHSETDFPNLFGKITFHHQQITSQKEVLDYITYSVEANKLMNLDEQKWEAFMLAEEGRFIDLIDSHDWKLVSEDGVAHKIQIPNFCDHNEVVWRWF